MTELERLLLELELKGLKEIVAFHVLRAEESGITVEQQKHIDDILDMMLEIMDKLKENDD